MVNYQVCMTLCVSDDISISGSLFEYLSFDRISTPLFIFLCSLLLYDHWRIYSPRSVRNDYTVQPTYFNPK
jgi:hypothetical protein